ncbi:MAG: alpha/beta hydrolase family esterase, partial [Candidatus Binatia bacterium]
MLGTAFAAGSVGAQATCSHEPTGALVTVIVGARTYQLYVPESLQTLAPGTPVPLLLSLHGLGGSGSNHAPNTGWMEFSETEPMVVAFPDGFRSWDNREDSFDVAYLREVVADIRSTYCIDPRRIHATGHSNGSFMAQRLACDAYDLITSIAPYAGGRPDNGLQGGPCSPERAVPVALFHGDADAIVNVRQGMATRDGWVDRLDCDTVPVVEQTTDGTEEIYLHCQDGVEVRWHVYPGQPHSWPEGARRDDLLARIWDFFERYPHPAPYDEGTSLPSNQPVLTQLEDLKARTRIELVAPDPLEAAVSEAILVELDFSLESNMIG